MSEANWFRLYTLKTDAIREGISAVPPQILTRTFLKIWCPNDLVEFKEIYFENLQASTSSVSFPADVEKALLVRQFIMAPLGKEARMTASIFARGSWDGETSLD